MKYSIAALSAVLSISAATRLKGTGTNRRRNVNVNTEDAAYAEQVEDIFTSAIEEEEKEERQQKDDGDGVVTPYIVGGINTAKDEYPYMVFAGTCGATLIASNVILTSARCADINEVNIGRWKLNDPTEEYETFNIIQKVTHPDFDAESYDSDFMVAQLDGHSGATPVEIDDGTQVVPMNTKIVIMGWGTNKENGTDGVNKLKDITIKKKGKNLCRNVYGSQVTSNNFCAKKNNKGVCTDSRDIGGPAIHKETGVQVGIISFSNEGQCSVDPVMLSKISAKYTWIMQQVEAMKSTSAPVSSPVGAVTSVPSDSPSEPPVPNVGNPSPVTPAPVTPAPVTPAPVTPAPVTPAPVTPAPVTPAPVTSAPVTSPVTPAPVTPAPVTPAPVTPGPVTPAPVTPAPVTSAPVTPAPVTPAPVTDEPTATPSLSPTGAPSLPPVGAVTPAPVTSAPIPSPSAGPSAAPTTRAQVVIPVALTKLQSAVDIIEDEL